MKAKISLEQILVAIITVVISGAVLPLLFSDPHYDYLEGSPAIRMVFGSCYLVAAIIALIHFRQVASMAARSKALIAMVVLAFASILWAESPSMVLRRAGALLGTTLTGILWAARFTPAERLRVLSWALRILAAASLVFVILFPRIAIGQDVVHPGDWIGVFGHKNRLGSLVAMAFLVDCFRPLRRFWRAAWLGLYLLLLVKSGSATPLAGLLGTWVFMQIYKELRFRRHLSIRAITLAIVPATAFLLIAGVGTGLLQRVLGRSADLSGRTELWQAMIPAIFRHPLLGYGYGGFWAGASKEYYAVLRHIYWIPMYAHNGYLEMMISLGFVGFFLSCLFLAQGGHYAILQADARKTREDLFPLTFLVYFLIRNVTEGTILYSNNFEWAICVAVVLSVLPDKSATAPAPVHARTTEEAFAGTEGYA